MQDSFGARAHLEVGNFIAYAFDDITLSEQSTNVYEPAALSISKQQTLQQTRTPLSELANQQNSSSTLKSAFHSNPEKAQPSPKKQPSPNLPFVGYKSSERNSGLTIPDNN